MILGIGLDIVDLDGFAAQLSDPASAFVIGTFTPAERQRAGALHGTSPTLHLAGRFAAKEAFLKAWSTARYGHPPALDHLDMRDIEVVADLHRRPKIVTHGAVHQALAELGPICTHLSISHDGRTAAAVVVLEQRAAVTHLG
ncbi:MAG: holo-ACP synthase [Myxococcota bacterium]